MRCSGMEHTRLYQELCAEHMPGFFKTEAIKPGTSSTRMMRPTIRRLGGTAPGAVNSATFRSTNIPGGVVASIQRRHR